MTAGTGADKGWADHNPSRIRQLFGNDFCKDPRTTLDLSLTSIDNDL